MSSLVRASDKLLFMLMLTLVVGCGRQHNTAPVSGRITNNGDPVPRVFVSFQPIGENLSQSVGPASYGHTDDQGTYRLRLIRNDEFGATVGQHRVILQHADDEQSPAAQAGEDDRSEMEATRRRTIRQRRIPERFRLGSVRFTVPASGTNSADFELSHK